MLRQHDYVLAILLIAAIAQVSADCGVHLTCDACISDPSMINCGWCKDEFTTNEESHCQDADARNCSSVDMFYFPKGHIISSERRDHIDPGAMTVALRPGEDLEFVLTVTTEADYPVDLYYLMDLSGSMHDDIDELKINAGQISDWVQNINNAENHLGFGSFVEKFGKPFTDTGRRFGPDRNYTYLFKNTMPLRKDENNFFYNVINSLTYNGNADYPEGGMDGLLQVAVCGEINWRPKARHIVFFATDADYHMGGDGKLLGINEPNDSTCRLSTCTTAERDEYCTAPQSHNCEICENSEGGFLDGKNSTNQDYPTVGQIKNVLQLNSIIPVFAVTNNPIRNFNSYKKLQSFLGFGEVILLSRNSDNVRDALDKSYAGLIKKIRVFTVAGRNSDLVQQITVDGGTSNNEKPVEASVDDVVLGSSIEFSVVLRSNSKEIPSDSITLNSGIGDLVIEVSMVVACNCSSDEASVIVNSDKCKVSDEVDALRGNFTCGACICPNDYYGHDCTCSGSTFCDETVIPELTHNGKLCNGQGNCVCGRCDCYEVTPPLIGYSGKKCECLARCPFATSQGGDILECGGPSQGRCDCGVCECVNGFTKDNCACPPKDISDQSCMPDFDVIPGEKKVCNGAALCVCGECGECDTGYGGLNCKDCDQNAIPKGEQCPKILECDQAKTCSECFDATVVGRDDKCHWCPGDSSLEIEIQGEAGSNTTSSNTTSLAARCLEVGTAVSECFCSLQEKENGGCNLHTSKNQCALCDTYETCPECKAAVRSEDIPNPKAKACEWCGEKCIEYELKNDICKTENIDDKVACDRVCLTTVSEETCKDREKINSALLDFACDNNGNADAVPPPNSNFTWPWCYNPEDVPDDLCEKVEWVLLWAERCPKPVNKGAIIGGVLGGLLGAAIAALLLWKLITLLKDKKEWQKWEADRAASKWQASQNPLFKSSTTEYMNPTYE